MATDPICGMFVDERTATLTLFRDNRSYYFCSSTCREQFAAPAERSRALRRTLAVAWPLALVALVATYGLPLPAGAYLAFGAATIVQFYAGLPFYRGTVDAVRGRIGNMDVLIAVGTTAAYGYSTTALALPGRLPPAYFFDASALIIVLILTGNFLEHLTRDRATGAVRRLRELLPARATVLVDGRETQVPVAEVRVGDVVRLRPGDRVPVDAVVVAGRTHVEESLLTGESQPVAKATGAKLLAGSINGDGTVDAEASRVGEDTFLAQVGQLMSAAEMSHAPLQHVADRIAEVFVPVVLGGAVVASLAWYLLGSSGITVALLVFVSVVITACPCAFGIATPAAIIVGIGRAAEEGVLFKGADALERAARADLVLTDKTGTLTEGRVTLTEVVPAPGIDESRLLGVATALEGGSKHPFARAVLARAGTSDRPGPGAVDLVAEPGRGVRALVAGRACEIVGGRAARSERIALGDLEARSAALDALGRSWSVVVVDGRPLGLLGFSDRVRSSSRAAVNALRADGVDVVMVTGDQASAARPVAAELGIARVHASVSPAGKVELVERLQAEGHHVAFVGDGVNDAAAILTADTGIAIGAGSDVAEEAGRVVLVRPEFTGVPMALRVARRTVRKVRWNLAWALGYNAVLLPVAAGLLVPWLGFAVYAVLPISGAVAMALSSTTVVLNSLSLRWIRIGAAGTAPTG